MGLLLLGWCGCHGAAEALAEILHARSDWWPQQVRLAQPYTPPGAAAPLPAGWQAVLVRVEGAEVVADFGRHGIRRLPLEDTDVLQQAAALRDQPPRRHGLLVTSLFNKFFHLEQDRAVQCKLQDFAGVEYVLFVYTDPCGAEGRAAQPLFGFADRADIAGAAPNTGDYDCWRHGSAPLHPARAARPVRGPGGCARQHALALTL